MVSAMLTALLHVASDHAALVAGAEVLQALAVYNAGALAIAQPQLVQLLVRALDEAATDDNLQALSAVLKVRSVLDGALGAHLLQTGLAELAERSLSCTRPSLSFWRD